MDKFIPTLNEAKSAGGTLGVMTIGFVGAHQLNKAISSKLTKGKVAVKAGIAGASALASVKVKNKWLSSALMAMAVYFGVSSLNDLAATPAFEGLAGEGIKSKIGEIIRKYTPQLSGDQDVYLTETEYQVLNSTPLNLGNPNVINLLGNPQPQPRRSAVSMM